MKLTPAPNYLQALWRLRADETRSLAEQVLDPQDKLIVFEIAKRCDRLVELIGLVQAATLTASLAAPDAKSLRAGVPCANIAPMVFDAWAAK
jgi:hypothetical protein